MRKIILSLFLIASIVAEAQKKHIVEKIYYFLTKDSLLGVKTQSGKVIIKPVKSYWQRDMNKPIKERFIYVDVAYNNIAEPHSWGSVFNRRGEFLFAPFFFDNGPDGFSEGLTRFVKNRKVGFANRNGDVVIEAKYDYVDAFNYGLASYCNGCVWKYKGEHSFVSGGTWGYINYKGDSIPVNTKRTHEKDQIVDSIKFLPYQFSYSAVEQKIIDSFYKLPEISKAYFVNYYSPLDSNERKLNFEIVERPSPFFAYYHVMAYEYNYKYGYSGDYSSGLNFYVDKKGRLFYFFDNYDKKTALGIWLKKYLKEAREYLKTHPDAQNKF